MPFRATDSEFDFEGVDGVLVELERRANAFIAGPGRDAIASSIEFSVEARYPETVRTPASGHSTQEIYGLFGTAVASERGSRTLTGVQVAYEVAMALK